MLWHAAAAALLAVTLALAQEEVDVRPATLAAEAWLELMDQGRYGTSWDEGAATFKQAVPRLRWETAAEETRGKLGNVVKRKLRSARYARSLPNAAEGEYVVIQNDTRFDNRLAMETVTLMKQADGAWRVAGYFIY
jgi:hypothetical protein